jgi:hypothetical protein
MLQQINGFRDMINAMLNSSKADLNLLSIDKQLRESAESQLGESLEKDIVRNSCFYFQNRFMNGAAYELFAIDLPGFKAFSLAIYLKNNLTQ